MARGDGVPLRVRGGSASVDDPFVLLPSAVAPSLELRLSRAERGPRMEPIDCSPNGSLGSGDVGVRRVLPMRMYAGFRTNCSIAS